MKQILFATKNESKVKRFSEGLLKRGIEIITLKNLNIKVDVEENGENAIENALIKARAYSNKIDIPVLAMDDNLYIENIPEEKQPGTYVRRVNGKTLSDQEMIEYYSNLAKEYGENGKLNCKWIYGIAIINKGKEYTYTWDKENIYIVDKPNNKINPGYPLSSISINKKINKYLTDITEEDKKIIEENEEHVIDFIEKCI